MALVTGGSSGIGRATALCFARDGAKIVVAARRSDEGEETAHLIQKSGGEAILVKTDISRAAEVQAMVATCLATFGRLDYACNNAGIEGPNMPTIDCREEDWQAVMDINSLKPMRWRGTPMEIAEAVARLCSDAASFVTGHSMIVDGGLLTI